MSRHSKLTPSARHMRSSCISLLHSKSLNYYKSTSERCFILAAFMRFRGVDVCAEPEVVERSSSFSCHLRRNGTKTPGLLGPTLHQINDHRK